MNHENLYLFSSIEGYANEISRIVSMLNYTRHTTLESVQGLTIPELDYLIDSESNSIGALLFHMAAVEFAYRIWTVEERDLSPEEYARWEPGLKLGEIGRDRIRGNDLLFYVDLLDEVRKDTLNSLKTKDDSWLYVERSFSGKPANNYFRWFHVFEDEINHRGQIRWMAKRIKNLRVTQ